MCYSAMVEQKLKSIHFRYRARIQLEFPRDFFNLSAEAEKVFAKALGQRV